MKKRILTIFFIILIIATVSFSIFEYIVESNWEIEHNTGAFSLYLARCLIIVFSGIILLAEIDIFYDVMYFVSDKSKRKKYKTIFNSIALIMSCGIIILLATVLVYYSQIWETLLVGMLGLYLLIRTIYLIMNSYYKAISSQSFYDI